MASVTELRREAVTVRLSRKRDITGRHKELLTELFYFTKHPDVPPDPDSVVEHALAESSDLKEFLSVNDLESGHSFQESTLPKLQTVAVNASTEQPVNDVAPKPLPITPATPQNANATAAPIRPVSSGSGRMVTRVSSGAIRHKSVGEILGGDFVHKSTPSRSTAYRDPSAIDSLAAGFQETPSKLTKSTNPPINRSRGTVFQESTSLQTSNRVDLDRLQAAAEISPLEHIVQRAHKTVTTSDWTKALREKESVAVCNRISELKEQNLWSLRQPAKQKAPIRPNAHWDYLLKEMEWMSTDFYEEKKFKIAGAYIISKAIREYFASTDRETLLHKWPRRMRTPVKHFEEEVDADEDVLMVNHRGSASPLSIDHDAEPIRDADKSVVIGEVGVGEPMLVDGPQDLVQPENDILPTPLPSSPEIDDFPAIFDLPSDVIYAQVKDLPKKDGSSFPQLPMYGPPTVTEEPYHNPIDEMAIVPISKFATERYVVPVSHWTPPNPHYRHTTPEEMDEVQEMSREVQVEAIPNFAPAGTDSNPSRRKSTNIIIRPPPPPAHYHEQRPPPWTLEEEQMLLQAAKDNLYNFDLVASTLAFAGSSVSDLEKRSAWECFEKYRTICPEPQSIQLMGPNRNAVVARLDKLDKSNRLSGGAMNRPKPNTIIRQPRLEVRNHRYLNLFDAMKKSAKNREKSKSQDKAAVKKTKDNLPTKPAVNVPSPLDLSRLKAERDRAYNQAVLAERQAQSARLQMPANATPEAQAELRRQWYLQQQQAQMLNAQANAQGIRPNPGLGRGLVIPGGPNGRPMPIRPNTGTNPISGSLPLRLPNGATATPEQMQQLLQARQQALANQNANVAQTPQQMQRLAQARALQQAQLSAAQAAAGQTTTTTSGTDYIPFIAQTTAGSTQTSSQVGNLVQNNRLMQPPQNGTVAQGIRQGTPQQLQLPQQPGQGLRATPPRPSNLSPTGAQFTLSGSPQVSLQAVTQLVQNSNPQLTVQEASKIALDRIARHQQEALRNAGTNGLMQQHLQQQLAKNSPTQANQQIRRSPSQPTNQSPQGQPRMS